MWLRYALIQLPLEFQTLVGLSASWLGETSEAVPGTKCSRACLCLQSDTLSVWVGDMPRTSPNCREGRILLTTNETRLHFAGILVSGAGASFRGCVMIHTPVGFRHLSICIHRVLPVGTGPWITRSAKTVRY